MGLIRFRVENEPITLRGLCQSDDIVRRLGSEEIQYRNRTEIQLIYSGGPSDHNKYLVLKNNKRPEVCEFDRRI